MSQEEYLKELALNQNGMYSKDIKSRCTTIQLHRMLKNKYIRREEDTNTNHKTYRNFITEKGRNFLKDTKWITI